MEFGDLRGILHYVPQFRNKLFVIKIDGCVVHSDNFSNVVLDLAVLHSLKINFIIVHDAQVQRNYHDSHEEPDLDQGSPTSEKFLELELNENSKVRLSYKKFLNWFKDQEYSDLSKKHLDANKLFNNWYNI